MNSETGSNLLSFLFSCVSWSEDNVIAFAGPEGIYLGSEQADTSEKDAEPPKPKNPPKPEPPAELATPNADTNAWARKSMENARNLLAPGNMRGMSPGVPSPSPSGENSNELLQSQVVSDLQDDYAIRRSKNWKFRQVQISCLTHVIFLTNPIFPSEHTTLITPHQSRIK